MRQTHLASLGLIVWASVACSAAGGDSEGVGGGFSSSGSAGTGVGGGSSGTDGASGSGGASGNGGSGTNGASGAGGGSGTGGAGGASGTNGAGGAGGTNGVGGVGATGGMGGAGGSGAKGGSSGSAGQTGSGGMSGSAGTGTMGTGGSATDPLSQARQRCVDRINQFRATEGKPPYQRWTAIETCTDGEASKDSVSGKAHGAFPECGESAQNECPRYKSIDDTLGRCLDQMWAEGPGADFQTHGHYINMSSTKYTRVACGFYQTSTGAVWAIQNFK